MFNRFKFIIICLVITSCVHENSLIENHIPMEKPEKLYNQASPFNIKIEEKFTALS